MTIDRAYDAWAAAYDGDSNLTRDLDAEVTRATFAADRFADVLEAGCGTGKNTGFYADRAARVVALDFAEGMLAQARAKVTADHVRFARADLTQPWPCADATADLVAFHLVLEHLADLPPVFAEAARCLRPGGRVHLAELHPFRQYLGGKARYTDGDGSVREVDAFVHHVSDFVQAASTAGLLLERLTEH
jgi:ubiquinone/menaquinone biosynthesis C-methylase UbiE